MLADLSESLDCTHFLSKISVKYMNAQVFFKLFENNDLQLDLFLRIYDFVIALLIDTDYTSPDYIPVLEILAQQFFTTLPCYDDQMQKSLYIISIVADRRVPMTYLLYNLQSANCDIR